MTTNTKLINKNIRWAEAHAFHLVKPSAWPFLVAATLVFGATHVVQNFFQGLAPKFLYENIFSDFNILQYILVMLRQELLDFWWLPVLLLAVIFWFHDVILEATKERYHTKKVQLGLRYGMLLFIVSEIMFFFGLFFGYFYIAWLPPKIISGWPPAGFPILTWWGIPLLNTVILLSSGISLTWAHRALVANKMKNALLALELTINLGIFFTLFQIFEYKNTPFSIDWGVYASFFYVMTGFHGAHVIIGTIFLLVCYYRQLLGHFTVTRHLGFEAAAWYWHFVDVVWIFLFIAVYIWGSGDIVGLEDFKNGLSAIFAFFNKPISGGTDIIYPCSAF
jgi:cytochrome c oxidase subunit III